MDNQKCPNCAAPMILKNNRDGTTSYHCNYCGYIHNNRPKTAVDRVFTFVNRAVNAFKGPDDPFEGISPEKKAELEQRMESIKQKEKELYAKMKEKELRDYENYMNKRLKKQR